NHGVIWAGGSDYSVTPYPARYGLWASVVRETMAGADGKAPFGMAETVDVHTALQSYTIWARHQLFLELQIGCPEGGQVAVIAVVAVGDKAMYAIPPAQLKDLACEMTLDAGKIVSRRAGR